MILLFEVPAAAIRNLLHIQDPHCVQSGCSRRAIFFSVFCVFWIVTVSSHNVEFIKQIKDKSMSEWNIKTRLSSAFLIVRRQRLHLLTASQRESKEITKTGFYFAPGSFYFTVPMIAALWLMLFVSFILSQSREDQHCTAPVLGGLILPKIHTCVFGGLHKCIWLSRLVQNNRLLLGGVIGVSIKPVWGRDERNGTSCSSRTWIIDTCSSAGFSRDGGGKCLLT